MDHAEAAEPSRVVSARLDVAAPRDVVFELIADPARQPDWDGNDNLASAPEGQRVHAVGDVFTMNMTMGTVRENTVVEYDEGRLIAWLPNVPGEPAPGHLWRWELDEAGDGGTTVTHTYDWTDLEDPTRLPRAQATREPELMESVRRLAALAEGPAHGGDRSL